MLGRWASTPPWPRVLRVVWAVVLAVVALVLGLVIGKVAISPAATTVVAVVGLVFSVLITLLDPRRGLLLWVAVSPFARFVPLDVVLGSGIPDFKLDRVVGGVLLLLMLAQMAVGRLKRPKLVWADGWLVLFTLVLFPIYLRSSMSMSQILQAYLDRWLVPLIVYLAARMWIRTRKDAGMVAVTLGIVGVYLGLVAVHEQVTGIIWFYVENRSMYYTEAVRRVIGLLGNPAWLAACLAIAAPFVAWALVEARPGWRKVAYTVALAAMAAGSAFCYNRAGWIAFVAALLVMIPFYPKYRKTFLPVFIVAAVGAVIGGGALIAIPSVRQRLTAGGPIRYRTAAIRVTTRIIQANPMFGVGQGNYAHLYNRYALGADYQYFDPNNPRVEPSPHNSILVIAVTGGVVSALPYVLFLLSFPLTTLRFHWRTRKRALEGREILVAAWGSFAAYNLAGLAGDVVTVAFPSMLFLLAVGSALGWMTSEGRALAGSTES
jgi:O-antigen ligase